MRIQIEGDEYREKRTLLIGMRHTESTANLAHQIAGSWDVPLTDVGREQARGLGRMIKRFGPYDNVWSSTKRRASEATHLATGVEPEQLEELVERDFGEAEGDPVGPDLISFLTGPYRERVNKPFAPGGETDIDIMNRWDRLCDRRGLEMQGRTTVLGMHASIMETLWTDLNLVRGARPKKFGRQALFVVEATGNPRTPDFSIIHTSGIVYQRTTA